MGDPSAIDRTDAPDKCLNCGHLWQYHGGRGTNECNNLGGASPGVAACDCRAQSPRDCPHGHRWGKCDTCDLIECERDLAAARDEIAEKDVEIERLRSLVESYYLVLEIVRRQTQVESEELRAEIERLSAALSNAQQAIARIEDDHE